MKKYIKSEPARKTPGRKRIVWPDDRIPRIKGVETPLSQAEDTEVLKISFDRCKPEKDHVMIFSKRNVRKL